VSTPAPDGERRGWVPRAVRLLLWLVVIAVAIVVLFTWVFPWVESWQQAPTLGVATVEGQRLR
jgi:hypothetical protein